MEKKNTKNFRLAFTLIELLVVIAIIGILSGLIVVSMNGITQKATIAKSQIFSNSLRNALMLNLISEWEFDQVDIPAAGQTPDLWSGGNAGTLYGSGGSQNLPQLQTSGCVSGNCLKFDGTDDQINFGNGTNLTITDALTISFWINDRGCQGYNRWIINKGSNDRSTDLGVYRNYCDTFYTAKIRTPIGFYTVLLDAPMNVWSFVVLVFDSSSNTFKSYKNGQFYLSTSTSGKLSTNSNSLLIGDTHVPSALNPLYGLMDDLRIYNAAMQSSQIKEQYYAGLNKLFVNGGIIKEEYLSRISEYAQN